MLYGSGADASTSALAAVSAARRPTLLVLDDLPGYRERPRAGFHELADVLPSTPVLVVVTADTSAVGEDCAPRRRSALRRSTKTASARWLGSTWAARDEVEVPVERLLAASGGLPQPLHAAASAWARMLALRRLGDAASRVAAERPGLRAAEDDLAANIVELQAADERAAR